MYAFETLSQLVKFDADTEQYYAPSSCTVSDRPRFRHRGVLIDSSRHFLPIKLVKEMVRALRMHKMNLLHWHLTDDQSWPVLFPLPQDIGTWGSSGGQTN